MSADLIKQAGFGDDSIPSSRVESYKATEDKVDRIALAWLSDKPNPKTNKLDPQFAYANTHYVDGKGYFLHKEGFDKILKKQPKKRFGTIVLLFSTDKNGEIIRDSESGKLVLNYELKPWFFSEKKFDELRNLHKKWDLGKHDIEITCTGAQYQNLTIQPHQESYFHKLLEIPKHKTKITEELERLKKQIQDNLGRDVSESELNEAVGNIVAQTVTDESATNAFSDTVLEEIDGLNS